MKSSEIYDMYRKLFGDIDDSTKYVLSPMKLSQCDFYLSIDSQKEYGAKSWQSTRRQLISVAARTDPKKPLT